MRANKSHKLRQSHGANTAKEKQCSRRGRDPHMWRGRETEIKGVRMEWRARLNIFV
jgi:hypothetical protein